MPAAEPRLRAAAPRDASTVALLHVVVVACQALTIGITWPLWQARVEPPTLPMVPWLASGRVDCGVVLLASLALALWRPRAGALVHLLALAGAILLDETRLQPQAISLALLLFATLPGAGARLFGIAQLVSLWGWSGVHKLLSPAFFEEGGHLVTHRFTGCPEGVARALVVVFAAGEVALAVAACVPRTRPLARRLGAAMHLAILVWLSPLALDCNESVWPWTAALAFAAWVVLAPAPGSWRESWRAAPLLARVAVAAELLAPAGFELGVVPAPFAHALYCHSTPHGIWLHADGAVTHLYELPELNVFVPGTTRSSRASGARQGGRPPRDRRAPEVPAGDGVTETLVRQEEGMASRRRISPARTCARRFDRDCGIALALFTARVRGVGSGEPWPMPESAAEKLLPLLRATSPQSGARRCSRWFRSIGRDPSRNGTKASFHSARDSGARARRLGADEDPEVAATAASVLEEGDFAVGEPVDIVARWTERVAPASAFAGDVASALAAADTRWPADAVLERVQAERKREAPALPIALLDLATAIPHSEPFEYEEEAKPPPPPVAPPEPFAELPEPLLERLCSKDPEVSNNALLEIERTVPYAQALRATLLPRLVEAATRSQEFRTTGWLQQIDRCELDADPAPLVDLWRAWDARGLRDGIRYLVPTIARRGAKAEAVLRVIVRDGDEEVRTVIASLPRSLRIALQQASCGGRHAHRPHRGARGRKRERERVHTSALPVARAEAPSRGREARPSSTRSVARWPGEHGGPRRARARGRGGGAAAAPCPPGCWDLGSVPALAHRAAAVGVRSVGDRPALRRIRSGHIAGAELDLRRRCSCSERERRTRSPGSSTSSDAATPTKGRGKRR